MSSLKGQTWSYDLVIAVVVFMLTLAFLIFFWWSVSTTIGMPRGEKLSEDASAMADVLLSPGNPADWNGTVDTSNSTFWANISLLGIGEGFGSPKISQDKAEKILAMNGTNYTELKGRFISPYNFYVEMKEFYNCSDPGVESSPINCTGRGIAPGSPEYSELEHYVQVSGQNFTLGIPPSAGGARSAAVVNRFAIYNNSLVKLKVVLWTNQTWQ